MCRLACGDETRGVTAPRRSDGVREGSACGLRQPRIGRRSVLEHAAIGWYDDWHTGRHRFERANTEWLTRVGMYEDVGAGIVGRQRLAIEVAAQPHASVEWSFPDQTRDARC